jgi:acetyl-CoA acetyltransferase
MASGLSDRAVIAGIGQTEFSKNSGRSELQLAAEASLAALNDAGLTAADVDGMITYTLDSTGEFELVRTLGVRELRYYSRAPYGGAATCAVVLHAAAAVASGAADVVLIYRAFNERSGRRFGQPMAPGAISSSGSAWWRWYIPFGLDTPAKWASLHFQRYMHEYGVTNEDFGRYSVICRNYAANNPNAYFYQRPITLEDHQNSRWIVEPVLRLLDCCQESDGGVAMVITGRERAADSPSGAVRIAAAAQSGLFEGDIVSDYYHEDMAGMAEIGHIGRQLWSQSGLLPKDVQAAMLYDHFSPIVFMHLEEFGFCRRGEARDFIAGGNIEIGGSLPVNTHGGLLGEAYIHGVNHINEAVRQLRGVAVNQIPRAEHILVSAGMSGIILGKL